MTGRQTFARALVVCVAIATDAMAVEPAGLRGLQRGPVGEGVAFAHYGLADGEVLFRLVTIDGDERLGDDTRRVDGETVTVAVGSGFAVNPDLNFSLQLLHTRLGVTSELSTDPVVESDLTSDATELIAGPSLWFGDFMLGAHASVLALGKARDEVGDATTTLGSVMMPRLRLYAGIKAGVITGMARILVYSDARAKVSGETADGESFDSDVKRRNAAESSLDAKIQLDERLALAGSFGYVGAEQAARGALTDYFTYGLGGLYVAAPWLSLAGGARYTQPHYEDDADASVIADNLGGLGLDIGAYYSVEAVTANFGLNYTIPQLVSYRDDENELDVELERSRWDLTTGLILRW
jgi:hypothetical protein